MKQRTLQATYVFKGKGLHCGRKVSVALCPAPENHGIVFQRVDKRNQPCVKASVDNVYRTRRSTTLKSGRAKVGMVEHLLAALYALGIDNVLVQVDGSEVPILDGSAYPYIRTINPSMIVEQTAERRQVEIREKLEYHDVATGSYVIYEPSEENSMEVTIDFNSTVIGIQKAVYSESVDFSTQIAPARTFCFAKEVRKLRFFGLIKGGSLDNAIVIDEPSGYHKGTELRFDDECARHKLLDFIGDTSLAGCHIKGKITAYKPGHKINTEAISAFMNSNLWTDSFTPTQK